MAETKLSIHPPYILLDALLKFAGLCDTGGQAKRCIQEGMVRVNAAVCTQRRKKIYPGDRVEFAGETLVIV